MSTPLIADEIKAIRSDLKAQGLKPVVNMRVNDQAYAAGSISLYPSLATAESHYRWTGDTFRRVFEFVQKHNLGAINGTDYYAHDLGHVETVYGAGFAFIARKTD
jgi:hypothetical protein